MEVPGEFNPEVSPMQLSPSINPEQVHAASTEDSAGSRLANLSRASVEAYAKDMRIVIAGGGKFPTSVADLKTYLFKHRGLSL